MFGLTVTSCEARANRLSYLDNRLVRLDPGHEKLDTWPNAVPRRTPPLRFALVRETHATMTNKGIRTHGRGRFVPA